MTETSSATSPSPMLDDLYGEFDEWSEMPDEIRADEEEKFQKTLLSQSMADVQIIFMAGLSSTSEWEGKVV
ncbi:hypothetical protein [Roseobacter weihaiensis]|uniref:hypothetical protein n=1 Tax=Roseobacter weihaiensis TaxID=2763262 RepID=UPI001D0B0179|nr:hypothetical protein [Roseobacter sp. H9]